LQSAILRPQIYNHCYRFQLIFLCWLCWFSFFAYPTRCDVSLGCRVTILFPFLSFPFLSFFG
jgi:hypothetical protein